MLLHVHTHAFSTLPVVLSAISHFHCRYYLPSPTGSKSVSRSLEGAKRLHGSPSVPQKIITKDILNSLFSLTLQPDVSFIVIRTVWRIFMQFYGLLHFNEVSNLQISDITRTNFYFQNLRPTKLVKAIGSQSPHSRVLLLAPFLLLADIFLFYLLPQAASCLL